MVKQIVIIILIALMGCTMNNNGLKDYIVGKWVSEPKDTELGEVIVKVTFTKQNMFKTESFFGNQSTPLVVEGSYKFDGSQMIAESWNKGKTIIIQKEGKRLILKTDGEQPLILSRIN